MSNQIPGVPEGWEAVSFDYVSDGECWLDKDGDPIQHTSSVRTQCKRLIVRKIEKPAKYRPFKDAEEYAPHFDRAIKPKAVATMAMRVVKYSEGSVFFVSGLTLNYASYEDAFYGVEFDDGTPFGVRIDE
jgi:hypothetical protein